MISLLQHSIRCCTTFLSPDCQCSMQRPYSRLNQASSDMLESGGADDAVKQRVLNDLQRAWLSCSRMIYRGPGFLAVV
jgi:hypothetical protein